MIRKRGVAVGAGLALLLTGCRSENTDYAQYYQILKQGFSSLVGSSNVTLKQASEIPYASMGWRLNGGNQNIVVLGTDNQGEQLWTSAAHVVLLTQNGRIKRTVGLVKNLGGLTPKTGSALPAPGSALKAPYSDQRVADFPDIAIYSAPIACHGRAMSQQMIHILGKAIRTRRVDETCDSVAMGWSFTNSFWVDTESGFVWRSKPDYPSRK